jgi:hypothetical protein
VLEAGLAGRPQCASPFTKARLLFGKGALSRNRLVLANCRRKSSITTPAPCHAALQPRDLADLGSPARWARSLLKVTIYRRIASG